MAQNNASKQGEAVTKKPQPADPIHILVRHKGSSRAVRSKEVTLSSSPAQRLLERTFEQCSARLYNASVMLPMTAPPQVSDNIEKIISGYFDEIETSIEEQIKRQLEVMSQNDIDDNVTFTSSKVYKCDITSRYAARYIRLVQRYEYLVCLLEAIWLEGYSDNKSRSKTIFDYQRRAGKLTGKLIFLDNTLKKVRDLGPNATVADVEKSLSNLPVDDNSTEESLEEQTKGFPELKSEAAA